MPLLVTALVVKNDDVELAIVDVDIFLFTPEQDQEILQLISNESRIPFDNIRLAYTHTYSGPITFSQWIKDGIDLAKEWRSTIPAACSNAVMTRRYAPICGASMPANRHQEFSPVSQLA